MKQGITIERTCDLHDRPIVRIAKRRGRLSLEEVGDLLRHRPQLYRVHHRRQRPVRLRRAKG